MQRRTANPLALACLLVYLEALRRHYALYERRPDLEEPSKPSKLSKRKLKRMVSPEMAISLVQQKTSANANSSSSRSITFDSNITVHNLLVLELGVFVATNAKEPTISDTQSNNWVRLNADPAVSGTTQIVCFYALDAKAGATTVTVNPNGTSFLTLWGAEYSGCDTLVGPQSVRVGSGSSTTPDCGTIPISWANSLIIAAYAQGSTSSSATAGSGFTLEYNQTNASFEQLYVQDITGISSDHATALTLSVSETWYGIAVSFRPAQTATSKITLVQQNGGQKNAQDTNSLTVAYNAATTSGHFLALAATLNYTPSMPTTSVSDSKSNSWTRAVTQNNGGAVGCEVWYMANAAGGSSHTVTFGVGATSSIISMAIMEFAGAALTATLDQTNSASGTSTTPSSGAVTAAVDAIVIGVCAIDQTNESPINPTANWTNIFTNFAGTSATAFGVLSGINVEVLGELTSISGSKTATFTSYDGVHNGYAAAAATFNASPTTTAFLPEPHALSPLTGIY